ncbi:MAG: polysaccharide biosynthesis C-terminal domain-containing protein [Flavobacteriales bacterium]|nr:polysaccharide biosynthesis C-terminal domain-containing protein [Flavobacteriales bacterium]
MHTAVYTTDQYGIISELYSYVAFLVIVLMYGMETAYFRLSTQEGFDKKNVFSTTIISLFSSTTLFILFATIFAQPIADWLLYPDNKEFVIWFAIIVGLDALSAIPLAKLRKDNKPLIFALVNLANILINIGLNLFFLAYCLPKYNAGETNWLIDTFYNPELGVSYVFISNLIASIVKFLLLTPFIFKINLNFSKSVWKKMVRYGAPLLLAGLAGIVNETIDRIMLKRMLFDDLGEKTTMSLIGIYSACYKISIIMSLFIQAFRYAAEPFFFKQAGTKEAKGIYANILLWFVLICLLIFLGVNFYIDLIKYFVDEAFWVGLGVVPILLMAYVFLGTYYNLSVWFKLTNRTEYGALLSVGGALITIVLNYILIPRYNYYGSAIATLICYMCMTVASYLLGNKFYKIPYNLKKIFAYSLLTLLLYWFSELIHFSETIFQIIYRTGLILCFVIVVYLFEIRKMKST